MKNFKHLTFATVLSVALLLPSTAEAKTHSGNYVNEEGCLVVWSYETALFGLIKYNYQEDVFCNDDGSPVIFD